MIPNELDADAILVCTHIPTNPYAYPEGIQCTVEDKNRFADFCNTLCNQNVIDRLDMLARALDWKKRIGMGAKQFVVYLSGFWNIHEHPTRPVALDPEANDMNQIYICVKDHGVKRDINLDQLMAMMRNLIMQEQGIPPSQKVITGPEVDQLD